ncbi:PREDICTED: uncharacterized protein LOC109310543 [Crocodylus porosus]|uniref:uncharacterized protein LOC109310543 n=1 Tax=Crocodylus porosus TaxID=8502 RepID=UPI00093C8747|nr:PREDICTED: uncharacterized protein LOC109310543 [Crocodylus porosus]
MSLAGWLLPAALQPSGVVSSSSCTNALLKTSSRQPPSLFFVLAPFPPPDLAAGAAVQTHIIKPGLAGNVAESQQEDVRSGVPAGERSDPVGSPAQPGLIRRRESQQHRAMDSPGNTARIARKTRTPQGGGAKAPDWSRRAGRRLGGAAARAGARSAPRLPPSPRPSLAAAPRRSRPRQSHFLRTNFPGAGASGAEGGGSLPLRLGGSTPGRSARGELRCLPGAYRRPPLAGDQTTPKGFSEKEDEHGFLQSPRNGNELTHQLPSLPGIWMMATTRGSQAFLWSRACHDFTTFFPLPSSEHLFSCWRWWVFQNSALLLLLLQQEDSEPLV